MFIKYESPSRVTITLNEVETALLMKVSQNLDSHPQNVLTQLSINTANFIKKMISVIDVLNDKN